MPKTVATRQKPTTAGPSSRADVLARVDRRTHAGRVLNAVTRDLTDHVGGAPSAAEMLIIQAAALKATRMALLAEKLLSGDEIAGDDHGALAWQNGLRRDLEALGLARRVKDVTPSLADYLANAKRGVTA